MVKKNLLITGCEGQLGHSIKKLSVNFTEYNFIFKNKHQLDISDFSLVKKQIKENKIDTVINCAAYTNVSKAEKNKKLANLINNLAVENLANICFEKSIQLIHISTDYVFDGKKNTPYNENDRTNPINYYGYSKLEGEKRVLEKELKNSAIIRTSWLYSELKNNFVQKIVNKIHKKEKLVVVCDEVGSPTYSNDLALFIIKILSRLNSKQAEIYNFSNQGFCSRYEFACEILKIIGESMKIVPINSSSFKITRPKFSVLDLSKIKNEFIYDLNDWRHSLEICLKKADSYEI